jgi:hypothetical protein
MYKTKEDVCIRIYIYDILMVKLNVNILILFILEIASVNIPSREKHPHWT